MKLLALSGWPKSGKDTVAEHLVKKYGFVRISSGDFLKQQVASEHSIPLVDLHDVTKKDYAILHLPVKPTDEFGEMVVNFMRQEFRDQQNQKPTDFLLDKKKGFLGMVNGKWVTIYWTPRAIGSFEALVKRAINQNYWIEQSTKELDLEKNYILTDWRFKSEQKFLKEKFGNSVLFVRINRFEHAASSSPFEHDLDDAQFDAVLDNSEKENVTVEELYAQVDELLRQS